jgi:hypothetical protein
MPLHHTGLVSRRELDHPDEKPRVEPTSFERVLKFNPYHDKQTGRFTSSGGGRRGGTAGSPTHDAFGAAMGRPRRSAEAAAFGGGASLPEQRNAAAKEMYRKMRAGEGGYGYTKDPTGGRHIPGLSPLAVRDWPSLQAKGRALDASVGGPATPESAHIRRQAHTSFQTKSGQKHVLNPAKATFRI